MALILLANAGTLFAGKVLLLAVALVLLAVDPFQRQSCIYNSRMALFIVSVLLH
ncbi:hypothetical protein J14TS2_24240 [Bacillus sp. J14TS2]|uniref:hypothetical protein n=1 Tax=Bacillus sp. J14TS2 TaxID=2807188 RepID=UPI001B1DA3F1|nr:hypothetical protein [Bacillus sp. J14TS2]GIN71949.1 hypothetical protein J14TS2_24240 [Bacillus sp. J14TS2]